MVDVVVRLEGTSGGRVRLHFVLPAMFWGRREVLLHGFGRLWSFCMEILMDVIVPGDHFEISRWIGSIGGDVCLDTVRNRCVATQWENQMYLQNSPREVAFSCCQSTVYFSKWDLEFQEKDSKIEGKEKCWRVLDMNLGVQVEAWLLGWNYDGWGFLDWSERNGFSCPPPLRKGFLWPPE